MMARGRLSLARFRPLLLAMALAPLLPALLGAERPPGLGDVRDVRTWSYPDYTRVVVELTRSIPLEADPTVRLPADRSAGREHQG